MLLSSLNCLPSSRFQSKTHQAQGRKYSEGGSFLLLDTGTTKSWCRRGSWKLRPDEETDAGWWKSYIQEFTGNLQVIMLPSPSLCRLQDLTACLAWASSDFLAGSAAGSLKRTREPTRWLQLQTHKSCAHCREPSQLCVHRHLVLEGKQFTTSYVYRRTDRDTI